jgi:hypothetical protein
MAIDVYPPYGSSSNPSNVIPNNENMLAAPWNWQVARGLVSGATAINIFAASNNVGTGSSVTLWELTGTTAYAFPASAQQMRVSSTSATDTGLAKVQINGLDTDWNLISETVTLNGTANVTTVNSYLRINNMVMITPATGQTSNVGTITLKNTSGTVTYAQITIGYGRTAMSIYSVPSGYTLWVSNINIFSGDGNGGNAYINYQARTTNNNVTPANTITALNTTFGLVYSVIRQNPFPYTQKSDVQWQFSTNTGTHSVGLILEATLISNTAS